MELQVVAAYIDGALEPQPREIAEAHLAECPECQDEVVAVAEVVRARARRRRRMVILPAATAAAAALLVFLAPWIPGPVQPGLDQHRDERVDARVAPELIEPRGSVVEVPILRWRGFPGADRYEVTVFDDQGRVRWRGETGDTAAGIPDSVAIEGGLAYFWQVRARTNVGRWVPSPLADFRVLAPGSRYP